MLTLPVVADTQQVESAALPGTAGSRDAFLAELAQVEAQAANENASERSEAVDASATQDVPASDPPALSEQTEAAPVKTEPAEPVLEGEAAKRAALLQKQEKRAREALAKERAEIEKMRAEVQAQAEEYKRLAELKARAKYDAAALAELAGIGEDDFEPIARDLYARSKAGREKPENIEAARRMQREREYIEKVQALEQRIATFEQTQKQREQQAQVEKLMSEYIGGIAKTAQSDAVEAPLLRNQLQRNPARAQQAIQNLAESMYAETGEVPDASDVIARYEQMRSAELEELGIDPRTIGKRKPAPTSTGPSRTLAPAGSVTPPMTGGIPTKAEILAELEKLTD